MFSAALLAAVPVLNPLQALAIPVDPSTLEKALTERREKVSEFRKIAEEAKRRGLRVYLAGGFAASYGDFIKHQLLSENGSMKIQAPRLENILSNIAFPEQDLDLVVTRADGTAESTHDLQSFKAWLDSRLPYAVEGRSKWDVIGLKTSDGNHVAVKGNPDFARQNNDSLSIGMIELTKPSRGESVIHEADHVAKDAPLFLSDLAGDSFRFLVSAEHRKTSRARAGDNPEIMGVIRVLTKSFQFQKHLPPSDVARIQEIIRRFNPSDIPRGSYAWNWIQGRAKRLITHAYDPQEALEILDQIGLLRKLNQMGGSANEEGSLAWWLNKKPLPIQPSPLLGNATGKTAAQLGITRVAHKTGETAQRMISWRYDGLPRGFVSRVNQEGEAAAYGDGFYTEKGTSVSSFSANQSGSTIIFDVDPNAVEGRDFTVFQNTGVLWKRGSALRVRQQALSYSDDVSCYYRYAALNLTLNRASAAHFTIQGAFLMPGVLMGGVIGGVTLFMHMMASGVHQPSADCLNQLGATYYDEDYADDVCWRIEKDHPFPLQCIGQNRAKGLTVDQAIVQCGGEDFPSKECVQKLQSAGAHGDYAVKVCSKISASHRFTIDCVMGNAAKGDSVPQAVAQCGG